MKRQKTFYTEIFKFYTKILYIFTWLVLGSFGPHIKYSFISVIAFVFGDRKLHHMYDMYDENINKVYNVEQEKWKKNIIFNNNIANNRKPCNCFSVECKLTKLIQNSYDRNIKLNRHLRFLK